MVSSAPTLHGGRSASAVATYTTRPPASIIGFIFIAWLAPFYFFRAGRSIVLYVGEDPRVLAELAR